MNAALTGLNAWNLYFVRYPGATNRDYGYITFNFFDKFEQMETPYPVGLFAKSLPHVNVVDVGAQFNAVRKLVRSEVLNLVDQVQ